MVEIGEDVGEPRGESLTRSSLRAERDARRRHIRNNVLTVAGILAVGCVTTLLIVFLTMRTGGLKVPDVMGLSYKDAKARIESAGLFVEIDPMQDASGDFSGLKVEMQDPKEGSSAEKNDTVVVRLKGLHESARLTGREDDKAPERPSDVPEEDRAQPAQQPAAAQPSAGRVVCLDPGHSSRSGSEIDPATGLNVGDNQGAAGELETMWELAVVTKARLEQAGYAVRLTKSRANEYVSLRSRAEVGNTCSIVVRLHYDDSGYTGVMRPPANAARCPQSDPSRKTVVDPAVAAGSDALARALAGPLGLAVRDDTGGTSQGNSTPPGHPTCLVGSALSRVPVVCIENKLDKVRNNPSGRDEVASQIVAGVQAFFQAN